MDYITKQSKLSKEEWESIEVPLPANEKQILALIQDGFHNVNISRNYTPTLVQHMKITMTAQIETYLYVQYFQKALQDLATKFLSGNKALLTGLEVSLSAVQLKKADLIRLDNTSKNITAHKQTIFEFILLDLYFPSSYLFITLISFRSLLV